MSTKQNNGFQLNIEKVVSNGCGLGHADGQTIFVPFTTTGDVVQIEITHKTNKYSTGKIQRIISPAKSRIESDCPQFSICGGCDFRHIAYPCELKIKQDFVLEALKYAHCADKNGVLPLQKILPSPQLLYYRNKAIFQMAYSNEGKIEIGYFREKTHEIIDISHCLLLPEIFSQISEQIKQLLAQFIADKRIVFPTGFPFSQLLMRKSSLNDEILVCFSMLDERTCPAFDSFFDQLSKQIPEMNTLLICENHSPFGTSSLQKPPRVIFGKGFISDKISGVPVDIGIDSFFQINHPSAENLYAAVQQMAQVQKTDVLLDVYCGMGTIGLSLANLCQYLIGVEIIPEAVKAAKKGALSLNLKNTSFFCEDAEKLCQNQFIQNSHPNLVILDPPRKGCDRKTLDTIIKLAPQHIVMVSCDPATAARDLHYLMENAYTLSNIQPVDMFPRTHHVETVVLMSRVDK